MKRRFTYRAGATAFEIQLERLSSGTPATFRAQLGDEQQTVEATVLDHGSLRLSVGGRTHVAHVHRTPTSISVALDGRVYQLAHGEIDETAAAGHAGSPEIRAPMPGKILAVRAQVGDQVEAGDDLVVLEAMKMENRLRAEIGGRVAAVEVGEGDRVEAGDLLVRLDPD